VLFNLNSLSSIRYGSVSFSSAVCITVHGIAGYFHSTLYGDETLSIVPESHSKGMFSWFPLFLPLCVPVRVQQGDTITFHIWRYVGTTSVTMCYETISVSICKDVWMRTKCGTSGAWPAPSSLPCRTPTAAAMRLDCEGRKATSLVSRTFYFSSIRNRLG